MRIAICIFGKIRALLEGYSRILKYILSKYEVDIFIHLWTEENNTLNGVRLYHNRAIEKNKEEIQESIKLIKNLFNPVEISTDKYHEYNIRYSDYSPYAYQGNNVNVYNMCSMFDSIARSNKLREKYEQENNFKYDCVLQTRLDIDLISHLDLYSNLNKLNVYGYNDLEKNNNETTDAIMWSSSYNMSTVSRLSENIIECMDKLKNNGIAIDPHKILKYWIKHNNLEEQIHFDIIDPKYKLKDVHLKFKI